MVNVKVFVFLALAMVTMSFAATCAEKSYHVSCSKCSFDNGTMDQKCYQSYQDKGVACLFAAYPVQTIQYKLGNCPGIDVCVNKLQECKGLYTRGNDQYDCQGYEIDYCFVRADECVAVATQDCSKPPPSSIADVAPPPGFCDGVFFFILPVFVGSLLVSRKN